MPFTGNMAELFCFFHKDSIIIKNAKKKPFLLRMIAIVLMMITGVYIFSLYNLYSSQKGIGIQPNLVRDDLIEQPCPVPNILLSEPLLFHYPEPTTYKRNECKCTPVQFFAILSMQRSGSGWFETLLNSHSNISSHGEIFSVKERRKNMTSITKTLDKLYNLDWSSSSSKNECTAAIGLKWMLNQGVMQYHEEIVSYFNHRAVTVLFLFRRNLLRRWISVLGNDHDRAAKQLNGTHKAHVHTKDEAEVLARYRPTINSKLLIPTLKQAHNMTADALKYFRSTRHTVLYYEDLVRNNTKLVDVLDFLRMPRRNLVSQHVKIHTLPLPDQIANWDEVSKILTGTEYENFLHSD